jgi:hemerythrin
MEAAYATALQWTTDLSVGCERLDHRNRALLDALASTENMIAAVSSDALAAWMQARLDQFAQLLDDEENELTAADYPELVFHRLLHDAGRRIAVDIRTQLRHCVSDAALAKVVRTSVTSLSLWFMRHVLDADPFFSPYVDVRYARYRTP